MLVFMAVMLSLDSFSWAEDSSESFLISSATTANPFPVSPAWAASMAAFMASRFVWSAMASMASFTMVRLSLLPEVAPTSWPSSSCRSRTDSTAVKSSSMWLLTRFVLDEIATRCSCILSREDEASATLELWEFIWPFRARMLMRMFRRELLFMEIFWFCCSSVLSMEPTVSPAESSSWADSATAASSSFARLSMVLLPCLTEEMTVPRLVITWFMDWAMSCISEGMDLRCSRGWVKSPWAMVSME